MAKFASLMRAQRIQRLIKQKRSPRARWPAAPVLARAKAAGTSGILERIRGLSGGGPAEP